MKIRSQFIVQFENNELELLFGQKNNCAKKKLKMPIIKRKTAVAWHNMTWHRMDESFALGIKSRFISQIVFIINFPLQERVLCVYVTSASFEDKIISLKRNYAVIDDESAPRFRIALKAHTLLFFIRIVQLIN